MGNPITEIIEMKDNRDDPQTARAPKVVSQRRIAFVQACWHRDIVDQAKVAFLETIQSLGYSPENIDLYEVPGAFEIPLHAKRLASSGAYDAIVACAFIVNGGIYRHEFVSTAVIDGLMQVQLETDTPVFSAVLTPHNFHDDDEQVKFFRGHFLKKGNEVARACAETVGKLDAISAAGKG